MTPTLTTDRLTLRGFERQDLPAYTAYYTGSRTGGVGGPLPEHKVFERFCAMIGHWAMRGFGRFAICLDPQSPAIGHVGPMQLDARPPEMTWTLWSPDHEGKGYATEAARGVLDHLFALGWTDLLAHVDRDNAPSHAVARRLGGQPTGDSPPDWVPNAVQYRFTPRFT